MSDEIQARFVKGPEFAELFGTLEVREHGLGCLIDVHPHVVKGDVPTEFIAEAMDGAGQELSQFGVSGVLTITRAASKSGSKPIDFRVCGRILVRNALERAGMYDVIERYYAAKQEED